MCDKTDKVQQMNFAEMCNEFVESRRSLKEEMAGKKLFKMSDKGKEYAEIFKDMGKHIIFPHGPAPVSEYDRMFDGLEKRIALVPIDMPPIPQEVIEQYWKSLSSAPTKIPKWPTTHPIDMVDPIANEIEREYERLGLGKTLIKDISAWDQEAFNRTFSTTHPDIIPKIESTSFIRACFKAPIDSPVEFDHRPYEGDEHLDDEIVEKVVDVIRTIKDNPLDIPNPDFSTVERFLMEDHGLDLVASRLFYTRDVIIALRIAGVGFIDVAPPAGFVGIPKPSVLLRARMMKLGVIEKPGTPVAKR